MAFKGRVLFLSSFADVLSAQLRGADLTLQAAEPLRDDISTDEISPLPIMVHFDATLGRYPYTGLQVQGRRPIGADAIREAGIEVACGEGALRLIELQRPGGRRLPAAAFLQGHRVAPGMAFDTPAD